MGELAQFIDGQYIKTVEDIESIGPKELAAFIGFMDNLEENFIRNIEKALADVFTESNIKEQLTLRAISEELEKKQGIVEEKKRDYEDTFADWSNDLISCKKLLEVMQRKMPGYKRVQTLLATCEGCLQTLKNLRSVAAQWQRQTGG